MSKLQTTYSLIFLLIAAFILRLFFSFKMGPFNFDEMFSFTYSQKPLTDSIQYWFWETNPPLHMIIEKIWFTILPASEFTARLLSVIFGTASVYALYRLGKLLFNRHIALLSAALLTVVPYHLFISNLNRGYSLLLLLAIISVYFFFKIFIKTNYQRQDIALAILVNILLATIHLTAIYIFFSQAVVLIIYQKQKIKEWLIIYCFPLSLYLGWLLHSLISKASQESITGSWFLMLRLPFEHILNEYSLLFVGPAKLTLSIPTLLIIITALFLVMVKQKKQIKRNYFYLLIFAIIPILVITFLQIWSIRFFVVAMPFLILSIVYALKIICQQQKNLYKMIIVFLIIFLLTNCYRIYTSLPLEDWKQLNMSISNFENNNKKQILLHNNFIYQELFSRYANNKMAIKTYYPYNFPFDEAVIKKNYVLVKHDEKAIANWLLANNIKQYDEVYLLEQRHFGVFIRPSLETLGFVQNEDPIIIRMSDSPRLYSYAKNTTSSQENKK